MSKKQEIDLKKDQFKFPSGSNCNTAVGYVLYQKGLINEDIQKKIFGQTAQTFEWVLVANNKIENKENLNKIPKGAVIALIDPKMSINGHVMLASSGGKAYGYNNGVTFMEFFKTEGNPLPWQELDLNKISANRDIYWRKVDNEKMKEYIEEKNL